MPETKEYTEGPSNAKCGDCGSRNLSHQNSHHPVVCNDCGWYYEGWRYDGVSDLEGENV